MAQEQSHVTDAERGRLILGELIKSFCQRVAVEKGGFEKTTKLPVSRVRKILKNFLSAHAAHNDVPAVTLSDETVRIMTSLAYIPRIPGISLSSSTATSSYALRPMPIGSGMSASSSDPAAAARTGRHFA